MTDTGRTRRHPRRQLAAEVQLSDRQGEAELSFDSADISEAGLFLKSDLLLDVGDEFDVSFTLPGHDAAMSVHGVVVRADRAPDGSGEAGPGMGIEFVNLSDEAREAITAYTNAPADDEG